MLKLQNLNFNIIFFQIYPTPQLFSLSTLLMPLGEIKIILKL